MRRVPVPRTVPIAPVALVALVALTLLLGGCDPGRAPAGTTPDGVPGGAPSVSLGLTQLIPQEGSRHALLRVVNTGPEELVLRSVSLEWGGYEDAAPSPADPVVPAGGTLDVRLELPDPTCEDPAPGAPVGVVDTTAGTARERLTPSGATYLRRLWRTQCDTVRLRAAVGVDWSRGWRVVGEGTRARARGALVLTRREGDEAVRVTDSDGSVLHDLALPGGRSLRPGRPLARLPLEVLPGNRCDEHARGQATAPFDFLLHLRVGSDQRFVLPLQVPLPAMQAATRALDAACAARP